MSVTQIGLVVHHLSYKSGTWLYSLYLTSTSVFITTMETKTSQCRPFKQPSYHYSGIGSTIFAMLFLITNLFHVPDYIFSV